MKKDYYTRPRKALDRSKSGCIRVFSWRLSRSHKRRRPRHNERPKNLHLQRFTAMYLRSRLLFGTRKSRVWNDKGGTIGHRKITWSRKWDCRVGRAQRLVIVSFSPFSLPQKLFASSNITQIKEKACWV